MIRKNSFESYYYNYYPCKFKTMTTSTFLTNYYLVPWLDSNAPHPAQMSCDDPVKLPRRVPLRLRHYRRPLHHGAQLVLCAVQVRRPRHQARVGVGHHGHLAARPLRFRRSGRGRVRPALHLLQLLHRLHFLYVVEHQTVTVSGFD